MHKLSWQILLAWALAAFLILAGSINIFASQSVLEDFRRWGYPGWFHFVTGAIEWTAALLILMPRVRFWGAILAGLVMGAAAATVVWRGEYPHSIGPFLTLLAAAAVGWTTAKSPRADL